MSKNKGEVMIRINAEKRVYEDSPNTTVTYKDLARTLENILDLVDSKESSVLGFRSEKPSE